MLHTQKKSGVLNILHTQKKIWGYKRRNIVAYMLHTQKKTGGMRGRI